MTNGTWKVRFFRKGKSLSLKNGRILRFALFFDYQQLVCFLCSEADCVVCKSYAFEAQKHSFCKATMGLCRLERAAFSGWKGCFRAKKEWKWRLGRWRTSAEGTKKGLFRCWLKKNITPFFMSKIWQIDKWTSCWGGEWTSCKLANKWVVSCRVNGLWVDGLVVERPSHWWPQSYLRRVARKKSGEWLA